MTPTRDISPTGSGEYGAPITATGLHVAFELIAQPGKGDLLREMMIPIVGKARTEQGC